MFVLARANMNDAPGIYYVQLFKGPVCPGTVAQV